MKKETLQNGRNECAFTLVEVVVVALIVLILSAVAIPMYGNYVRDARQSAADNLAETAASAANAYWRRTGQSPAALSMADDLKIYFDNKKHSVEIVGDSVIVKDLRTNDEIRASRSYK